MRQFTTLFLLSVHLLFAGVAACLYACGQNARCPPLSGTWSDREGQDLVFKEGGKAFWLTHFGSMSDTIALEYALDCSTNPVTLDLMQFSGGPHSGKILFGIVEWLSDSSFRFRYEAGLQSDTRPKTFDDQQTIRFLKK